MRLPRLHSLLFSPLIPFIISNRQRTKRRIDRLTTSYGLCSTDWLTWRFTNLSEHNVWSEVQSWWSRREDEFLQLKTQKFHRKMLLKTNRSVKSPFSSNSEFERTSFVDGDPFDFELQQFCSVLFFRSSVFTCLIEVSKSLQQMEWNRVQTANISPLTIEINYPQRTPVVASHQENSFAS